MMTFLVISLSVTVVWLAILVIVLYQSRRDELHEARLRIADLEGRLLAHRTRGSNLVPDIHITSTPFTGSGATHTIPESAKAIGVTVNGVGERDIRAEIAGMTDDEVRAEIERLKRDLNIRGPIGH